MGYKCSICQRIVSTVTILSMCADCNLAYEAGREDQKNATPVRNLDYCIGFVVQSLENKIMEECQIAVKEWINKHGHFDVFMPVSVEEMRITIKSLIRFKDTSNKDSK